MCQHVRLHQKIVASFSHLFFQLSPIVFQVLPWYFMGMLDSSMIELASRSLSSAMSEVTGQITYPIPQRSHRKRFSRVQYVSTNQHRFHRGSSVNSIESNTLEVVDMQNWSSPRNSLGNNIYLYYFEQTVQLAEES